MWSGVVVSRDLIAYSVVGGFCCKMSEMAVVKSSYALLKLNTD